MANINKILEMDKDSFRANIFTKRPFRAIGLVDVNIKYTYGVEKVTLAYYRSSGTNDGKVKGLWYPIVGIKLEEGEFSEFTEYINYVLANTTLDSRAIKGWLCKSLFFGELDDKSKMTGFSNTKHYTQLLEIGENLRYMYDKGQYKKMKSLDSKNLNEHITSKQIYTENNHSQRENFEKFVQDIYSNFR